MITVLTSHNHIWEPAQIAADIVAEYQAQGCVNISMNNEGPCLDSVGLYRMLDYLCEKFNFEKDKVTIHTYNLEEVHNEYNIKKLKQNWHRKTVQTSRSFGYDRTSFAGKKDPAKQLFGCMYNIPSWNRLSLLSFIRYQCTRPGLLACNGTWQADQHNTYYLNPVTDFSPEEFPNIARLLIDGIGPLPRHPGSKPSESENTAILEFYNDFFIDVVAETYTNGLTFFPTEKTFRPMYGLTPFIIFGPQGFLSTLKSDFGFKTFSDYWDEDYDNYQNYERIKKMYETMQSIDRMSDQQLKDMYQDMQPILEHNHENLLKLAGR